MSDEILNNLLSSSSEQSSIIVSQDQNSYVSIPFQIHQILPIIKNSAVKSFSVNEDSKKYNQCTASTSFDCERASKSPDTAIKKKILLVSYKTKRILILVYCLAILIFFVTVCTLKLKYFENKISIFILFFSIMFILLCMIENFII